LFKISFWNKRLSLP